MRQVINNLLYDSAKAEQVHNDTMYKTKSGLFFTTGSCIILYSAEEAFNWCEDHINIEEDGDFLHHFQGLIDNA